MQKPENTLIEQAVEHVAEKECNKLDSETKSRVVRQAVLMLTDMPEKDWEEKPDAPLDMIASYALIACVQFVIKMRISSIFLNAAGIEIPEDFHKFPYEVYPDVNFYEAVELRERDFIAFGDEAKGGESSGEGVEELNLFQSLTNDTRFNA